jgi:hypothetical protein
MALSINFTVSQSCDGKYLIFQDTTGTYSSVNPGGWGTPNPDLGVAIPLSANIIVTNPLGTVFNLFETFPDLLVDLPNLGTPIVAIGAEHLGGIVDSVIADGTYAFTYSFSYDEGQYIERQLYFFFDSQAKCCVDKMFAQISSNDCCCDQSAMQDAMTARGLLIAAEYAGRCGQVAKAADLLTTVNKLCNNTGNCLTCK